jgi:4-hydroxy-tetrahydrodipicolinate synthase
MSFPGSVIAPVLTPFDSQLEVDPLRFVALCRVLLDQGVDLAPFGTTSEGPSLSVDERLRLLDALAETGVDMGRVMPGTGCCALPDTVRLSAHAARLGCGAVLMLPPFYYKGVSDDALFASFAAVIERVADPRLKVVLYHFPRHSQTPISLELVDRLRRAFPDTVVGLKDSSGDWDNMRTAIERFPGFHVWSGTERLMLDILRAGGAGVISANANLNGRAMLDLAQGWRGAEAKALQTRLDQFRAAVQGRPLIPALKAMLADWLEDPEWRHVRPPQLLSD